MQTEHELNGLIFLSFIETNFSPLIKLFEVSPIKFEKPTPKLQYTLALSVTTLLKIFFLYFLVYILVLKKRIYLTNF